MKAKLFCVSIALTAAPSFVWLKGPTFKHANGHSKLAIELEAEAPKLLSGLEREARVDENLKPTSLSPQQAQTYWKGLTNLPVRDGTALTKDVIERSKLLTPDVARRKLALARFGKYFYEQAVSEPESKRSIKKAMLRLAVAHLDAAAALK